MTFSSFQKTVGYTGRRSSQTAQDVDLKSRQSGASSSLSGFTGSFFFNLRTRVLVTRSHIRPRELTLASSNRSGSPTHSVLGVSTASASAKAMKRPPAAECSCAPVPSSGCQRGGECRRQFHPAGPLLGTWHSVHLTK